MINKNGVKQTGFWVLLATILGSSLVFMDGTIVNVALPEIQHNLNASITTLQWVVEAYALALTALLLVGGSLGDRFGRRRIFSFGIVIFSFASLWCGLSESIEQLIIARSIQGIGGALLVPGSLAIISAYFPEEERGKAIGVWSGFAAMTTALGPVLGGWLVENISWRWAFYINLPFAVIVLLVLYWRVPESKNENAIKLDWLGALLVTLGLGTLVYGLIESVNLGFSNNHVIASLSFGTLFLICFIYSQSQISFPMMPLHLFDSRNFSGANLLTFWLYAALGGALFFLPFNLIQVQGYTATEAGASLLPLIFIIFIFSRWAGGLVAKHGAKRPLVIGSLICAVAYALLAVPTVGGSYWQTFFIGITVLGLGMAIVVAPLTTTVMNAVEQKYVGIASGINNGMSRAAGLIAIALLGIIMFKLFNIYFDEQLSQLSLPQHLVDHLDAERIKLAGIVLPIEVSEIHKLQIKESINIAYVTAFRWIMGIATILSLLSALTAWRMIESKIKGVKA